MKFALFTLTAALLAAAAPVQAQQQPAQPRQEARGERKDPQERIERRVQRLDEKLNLSDDQVARIRTILTQESEQMRTHVKRFAGTRGARPDSAARAQRNPAARDSIRNQMQQMRERTDAAILQVLNADQRTAYQKFQQEMKERGDKRGQRGERRRGGDRQGTRAS